MLNGRGFQGPTVADVLPASRICFELAERFGGDTPS